MSNTQQSHRRVDTYYQRPQNFCRSLEEEDDSDATYCSAVEEHNIILGVSAENTNSNTFQLQKDSTSQYHCNVNEEKFKIQPSTSTGIKKKSQIISEENSPLMFSSGSKSEVSRSKSKNVKHIQQRLVEIRDEVNGWLTGWGKELNRSQIEQLVAELQHLYKAVNASSFPNLKVLAEMKQVAEKLQYQLNSALDEVVDDLGNSCCNCGCSCGSYNECTSNVMTEPSSHKPNISSRDPRLLSIAYCSLMSSKAHTYSDNAPTKDILLNNPCINNAETETLSQNVHRMSSKRSSVDALSYSADMFETYSFCGEKSSEQKNNHFMQDSVEPIPCMPGGIKSVSKESLSVNTTGSNSTMFVLQNEKCDLKTPKLSRNREEFPLDQVRNQFQNFNLANTKGAVCNSIMVEKRNDGNQFKSNSLDGSKMVNLSGTTRSQLTWYEKEESTVSIQQCEHNESNMSISVPAEHPQFLMSECKEFEVTDNFFPPHSNHRNQSGSTDCEKCYLTLTNNSKDPLSVDIFASCATACHIMQKDMDAYNVLPAEQAKSKLPVAASPVRKKSQEKHWKEKSVIPSESLQSINREQTLPQLAVSTSVADIFTSFPSQSAENIARCTYSKTYSETKANSKKKKLQNEIVSQRNQISQAKAKKKSTNNVTNAIKTKGKRIPGGPYDIKQSASLSLDMFASDTQTFTVSENKGSYVNEKSLKCSKMALNQIHENHTLNISKKVELKQESLAYCIKRIRLPCLSEYLKNSQIISNFWNGSPYPLPQEIKDSVENW